MVSTYSDTQYRADNTFGGGTGGIGSTPNTGVLTFAQIKALAASAGWVGDDITTAAAIAEAESSGRISATLRDDNGTIDRGIWQINSSHTEYDGNKLLSDPSYNAGAAFAIFQAAKGFSPWTTYNSGAYQKYLNGGTAGTGSGSLGGVSGTVGSGSGTPSDPGGSGSEGSIVGGWPAAPPVSALPAQPVRADRAVDLIRIRGTRVKQNLRDAVLAAQAELSSSELSEITLTFADSDLALWAAGEFQRGTKVSYEDQRLIITGRQIQAGSDNRPSIVVTCRSALPHLLMARQGALTMTNVSPTDFLIAECKAVGASYVAQPSQKRTLVSRDVATTGQVYSGADTPSSWTTFGRLAGECGFIIFETGGTVYFGRPSWLIKNTNNFVAVTYDTGNEETDITTVPGLQDSDDAADGDTVSFGVPMVRASEFRPGMRCVFSTGLPGYNGVSWMVDTVSIPLAGGSDATIGLIVPKDPVATGIQSADATSAGGLGGITGVGDGTGGGNALATGTRSALDFVAVAYAQLGDKYLWGGDPPATQANPSEFDCEGLVRWAAGRVGVDMPAGSEQQLAYCQSKGTANITVEQAASIRGALCFHPGHVVISLGNGKTIEAADYQLGVCSLNILGRSTPFTDAAYIPGMDYGSSQSLKNQQELPPAG